MRRRRRKSGKSLPVVQYSVPVAGVEQASLMFLRQPLNETRLSPPPLN